jgi:type IV pilus assembly protein PilY1
MRRLRILPALFLLAQGAAQAATDISTIPLYAIQGVDPNIALTIDDSGSMQWAYVPDSLSTSGQRFRSSSYNGMYYNPATTYVAPPDENGVPLTTSFSAAWLNGFNHGSGSVNLSNAYRATIDFNPGNSNHSRQGTLESSSAYAADYYVFDSSNTGCNGTTSDNDCYDRVIVSSTSGVGGTDERQNFANWYSFYRTRNLATVSAALLAFQSMPETVRVAWQALNTCTGFPTNSSCYGYSGSGYPSALDEFGFGSTHRTNFFKYLMRLPANSGTPLVPRLVGAGEMFKGNRAYQSKPGVNVPGEKQAICRPNFSIVMTDGIWNSGDAGSTVGDADDTSRTLPDGTAYGRTAPYPSSSNRTLADAAFYYWANDLNTSLDNDDSLKYLPVKTDEVVTSVAGSKSVTLTPFWNPKNDPATWQHMTTFTIGLGLSTWLGSDWAGDTWSGAYRDFATGERNWPGSGSNVAPGNVYDLWHAAINGRGQFFSAETPNDVVDAFEAIMASVLDRTGSATAASVSSAILTSSTLAYQVLFNTTDWSGDLKAYRFSDGSGNTTCDALPLGSICPTASWSAASLLDKKGPATRNIITNNGGGVPFTWANLSATQQAYLNGGDSYGSRRLDFIRGVRTDEGGLFRTRSSVLGDIVNAHPAPLYVGATKTFPSRTPVVYAGANDGMLHGFDATTGNELFAFVPNAAFPNLIELTKTKYDHRAFVDGGMTAQEIKVGGVDKTYLVGALGLGGRAVYILDITNPAMLTVSNASSIFRGEFTHTNLGYLTGAPKIVQTQASAPWDWVAVFGSGYNASDNKIGFFVVPLTSPGSGRFIQATEDWANNGISSIATVDNNGDGFAESVYGGDLFGNLWKLDLSAKNASSWKIAYSSGGKPAPAYVALDGAGNRQPITAAPVAGSHPSSEGEIVYFGTGRYLGVSDITDQSVQSIYAIWVKPDHYLNIKRSHLLKQEILQDYTSAFATVDARQTSNYGMVWYDEENKSGAPSANTYLGWYMDFNTEAGERVHQAPFLRLDRIIFATVTPNDDPCSAGGSSWIYELDRYSGSRLKNQTPFDYNNDGLFDSQDYVGSPQTPGSGIRVKGGGINYLGPTGVVSTDGNTERKVISSSTGSLISIGESGSAQMNRTWMELIRK